MIVSTQNKVLIFAIVAVLFVIEATALAWWKLTRKDD